MNVFLWIVAALLAAVFATSGAMKLLQPKEKLAASGLAWVEDFSAKTVKTIGVLEILAAIGLILPPVVDIATILAPLAALGLVLLMLGAALTHLRRREAQGIAVTLVLIILALVVLWGRVGPHSFTA